MVAKHVFENASQLRVGTFHNVSVSFGCGHFSDGIFNVRSIAEIAVEMAITKNVFSNDRRIVVFKQCLNQRRLFYKPGWDYVLFHETRQVHDLGTAYSFAGLHGTVHLLATRLRLRQRKMATIPLN